MGFVRKVTGVQGQIDAANANASAQENATRQAAAAQQRALTDSAKAAAMAQAQAASRAAAEGKAANAVSAPLGNADVQLDSPDEVRTTRTRRGSYGRSYSGSVSI